MKGFLIGVALILLLGVGGFFYRATTEHPSGITVCTLEARVCPDGTAVGRVAPSCAFPSCPPPNVSIDSLGIAFALPTGYSATTSPDAAIIARYVTAPATASTSPNEIYIRSYPINASSTAIATIQASAIQDASGTPAPATAYSSVSIGTHRFTVVTIGRFEGVIDVAYYLARGSDVLRFDTLDQGADWSNPNLDLGSLPGAQALRHLLGTLQGN